MFRVATVLTALAAIATAAPAPQSSRGLTAGSLTWYTEGIGSAFTACGTMNTLTDVGPPSITHVHRVTSLHIKDVASIHYFRIRLQNALRGLHGG